MVERIIIGELRAWKTKISRKPLILRGARQVGKTTAVNLFARDFKQYIYLNLETARDRNLFIQYPSIDTLIQAIFFEKEKLLEEKGTLIFIDEIQEVPEALSMLRYFYEQYPQYCVVAAGSLLESLFDTKISFPVGRVEFKVVRPFSFQEFLLAMDEGNALKQYHKIPMDTFAHDKLLSLFHLYTLIGGMPEIVLSYAGSKDIVALTSVFDSLIGTYLDDVEKYTSTAGQTQIMHHAIRSVFMEAGNRIKFNGFGNSAYGSREMGEALRTIEKAMLIHLIYPTTQTGEPFMPDMKKSPRLQVLDTGMLNYMAHLQKEVFGTNDLNNVYKGHIAEHIVCQELLAHQVSLLHKPLFWVSEKKDSVAEIDFLAYLDGRVIPIEVKSGATGRLRSLHLFMDAYRGNVAVRLYAGEIRKDILTTSSGKNYTLLSLPYYLTGKIGEYLREFAL